MTSKTPRIGEDALKQLSTLFNKHGSFVEVGMTSGQESNGWLFIQDVDGFWSVSYRPQKNIQRNTIHGIFSNYNGLAKQTAYPHGATKTDAHGVRTNASQEEAEEIFERLGSYIDSAYNYNRKPL